MSKTVNSEPMTQSCGGCKWWREEAKFQVKVSVRPARFTYQSTCEAPVPAAYDVNDGAFMGEHGGKSCPCFTPKPKENENHE